MTAFAVKPSGAALGATVLGLDLAQPLSGPTAAALRQALHDHLVLCIQNQDLSPEAFATAARLFGPPKPFVLRQDRIEGAPDVSIVTNRPPGLGGKPLVQASHWHTDDSYFAEPATLTLLLAKTLPASGGDTEFINCYAVLEALPPALREAIEGKRAAHAYLSRRNQSWVAPRSAAETAETPIVDHPLIRTHPATGRQSLYINPNRIDRIVGWDDAASDALLDALYDHAVQPQFQYRHVWRPGDLVIWDNRCTLHRANADYDITQLRVMHRVMLAGERPV